jgi:hypothetical protein
MAEAGRFDAALRLLSAALAGGAFLWGVFQYNSTRREEFRRHFWDQQFALYQEAAGAAAEIAMAPHIDSVADARQRFWILYWGKLSMVEHPEVERAMIDFGSKLSACESGADTSCVALLPGAQTTELRSRAYTLSHCAQLSLSKTWQPLKLYPNSRCPPEYTSAEKQEQPADRDTLERQSIVH